MLSCLQCIYYEAPLEQCNFLKDGSIGTMNFFLMALVDQLKIAPLEKCNFLNMAPVDQCDWEVKAVNWSSLIFRAQMETHSFVHSAGNNISVGRAVGDDDLVTISARGKISPMIICVGDTSMLFPVNMY